jgi:hypothetical protein
MGICIYNCVRLLSFLLIFYRHVSFLKSSSLNVSLEPEHYDLGVVQQPKAFQFGVRPANKIQVLKRIRFNWSRKDEDKS